MSVGGKQVSGRAADGGREGAAKAAILLLAMGKPLAAEILRHFSSDELRHIPSLATELGPVSAGELERLVEEFAGQFSGGVKFLGTGNEVEQLLTASLSPEQIQSLVVREPEPEVKESVWTRLTPIPDETMLTYLCIQHPQTAALILGKLSSTVAARLVAMLPTEHRHMVVRRMCSLKPVSEQIMVLLEGALEADLLRTVAEAGAGPDTRSRMADILNRLDKDQVDELIAGLEEVRPEDAKALRRMLFSFEDLPKLSAQSRGAVMDKVSTDKLVVALRGTDASFQDVVLSALASRARRMVEAELASGEMGNPRDVAQARRGIAELALNMAARGEIELVSPEDAEGDQ